MENLKIICNDIESFSQIRKRLSENFAHFTDVFVLDSMPTPICKYERAGRSDICATYEIQPSFGHCAAQKNKYFGYKLHAVCDKNGVFHSFDLASAHIHDVNYLKDVFSIPSFIEVPFITLIFCFTNKV